MYISTRACYVYVLAQCLSLPSIASLWLLQMNASISLSMVYGLDLTLAKPELLWCDRLNRNLADSHDEL